MCTFGYRILISVTTEQGDLRHIIPHIHKTYHYLLMMIYSGHCCDDFSIASVEMRVEGASKYHWCYDNIKNAVAVARKNTSRWILHRPPILFFSLSAHHPPHVPI